MSEYFAALPDELASRPWPVHGRPRESPRMAREIEGCGSIIAAAEKELPLAEAHLVKAQAILGEAIQPEKVDVILPQNEFNQAIGRAMAL